MAGHCEKSPAAREDRLRRAVLIKKRGRRRRDRRRRERKREGNNRVSSLERLEQRYSSSLSRESKPSCKNCERAKPPSVARNEVSVSHARRLCTYAMPTPRCFFFHLCCKNFNK